MTRRDVLEQYAAEVAAVEVEAQIAIRQMERLTEGLPEEYREREREAIRALYRDRLSPPPPPLYDFSQAGPSREASARPRDARGHRAAAKATTAGPPSAGDDPPQPESGGRVLPFRRRS